MKKKVLITTLIAAPLLSLSSMAFAAEPASAEPVLLTTAQMDRVTAGNSAADGDNLVNLGQINVSPVTVVQLNVLNFGYASNSADVWSGNYSRVRQ
jgi:hypothetical protein